MELPTRRRALSTVLAIFLAVESVSAVAAAAATRTATHPLPAEPPAGSVLAAEATVAPAIDRPESALPTLPMIEEDTPDFAKPIVFPDLTPKPSPEAKAKPKAKDSPRDKPSTKRSGDSTTKASTKGSGSTAKVPVYRGSNHVWIPSLGINRSVRWFPCDRQRPPDNYMYRWGCAGANNVYLMGHAYGVMDPLHDAYVNGTLRRGMKAWYAGADGRVHVYAVRWWKVTLPTPDAEWAWAAQDVPSMTLQTCVGKDSRYRLMVRLVRVGS